VVWIPLQTTQEYELLAPSSDLLRSELVKLQRYGAKATFKESTASESSELSSCHPHLLPVLHTIHTNPRIVHAVALCNSWGLPWLLVQSSAHCLLHGNAYASIFALCSLSSLRLSFYSITQDLFYSTKYLLSLIPRVVMMMMMRLKMSPILRIRIKIATAKMMPPPHA
jgi:hypothetical protein